MSADVDGSHGDDDDDDNQNDGDSTENLLLIKSKIIIFLPIIAWAIWYPEKRRLFPCQKKKKEQDDRSKPMK